MFFLLFWYLRSRCESRVIGGYVLVVRDCTGYGYIVYFMRIRNVVVAGKIIEVEF